MESTGKYCQKLELNSAFSQLGSLAIPSIFIPELIKIALADWHIMLFEINKNKIGKNFLIFYYLHCKYSDIRQ